MSKRSILIGVLAIIFFIACIFSVINDSKAKVKTEPDQDPGTERNMGPRKGFYYDRTLKKYVPAKSKIESEELKPAEDGTGKEITL